MTTSTPSRSHGTAHVLAIRAGGEQRADEEIDAHRRVGRFHLRDAGLTRTEATGEIGLCPFVLLAQFAQPLRESEFDLYEFGFRCGQLKEVLCITDLPSGLRKLLRLFRFHDQSSASRKYFFNRAFAESSTCFGVVRVFFENISRITTASSATWYTIRQVTSSSTMRSSWHRAPISGIGREAGSNRCSPRCKRRRRK